jgi:hypothetical protein
LLNFCQAVPALLLAPSVAHPYDVLRYYLLN